MASPRSRAWCFTDFSVETEAPWFKERDDTVYCIVGLETCPSTGRRHFQGYIYWTTPISLSGCVKRSHSQVHWSISRGSPEQNHVYCTKEHVFYETGHRPEQGARNDILNMKVKVLSGEWSCRDVLANASGYQAAKYGLLLSQYAPPPMRDPPYVAWFFGPAGSGKTSHAIGCCQQDDMWISSGPINGFWNGYTGQRYVILDDIRIPESCSFSQLLRIIDRYPYMVNLKGSSTWLRATHIFITAPRAPGVHLATEDIRQLTRRITEIKEFAE